jgi:hypothetical protein
METIDAGTLKLIDGFHDWIGLGKWNISNFNDLYKCGKKNLERRR